jgi:phospholipid/cholesterol/gamma-HCH transport system permease protein
VLTGIEQVGRTAIGAIEDVGALAIQFVRVARRLPRVLPIVGKRQRWRTAVSQMWIIGGSALPMAGIMSLCTGFILALQSASELRRFGALQFVVNLVAVGFTRELGPLITAIAVSGRSASAISAEIGTMVVTEEVDALTVMGLDPLEFTVAPKFLAALITVPCLTILSTLAGIFAGYLFLAFSLDMSLRVYFQAVAESILLRDVAMTLVKSVAFATIIVQVGCLEGLRVRGGPEAVGAAATTAVVKSTFLVIIADLIATAFFYVMGWSSAG